MKKSTFFAAVAMAAALCIATFACVLQSAPMLAAGAVVAAVSLLPQFGLLPQLRQFGIDVMSDAHDAVFGYMGRTGLLLAVTLAADKPRSYELGAHNDLPVIASDIIFEGAAVGAVVGTGHTRPLVAGDLFVGFAQHKADNAAGAAAAINVRLIKAGEIELSVTGAVITDVNQPVYASDDDTFVFNPVGNSFIGFVKRFVSSGKAVVDFNASVYQDPYGDRTVREVISANKTLAAADTGKLFWVDTDALIITLPAIADGLGGVKIVNGGAFGAVAVNLSPQALDMVLGPNITGADNKDLINTKATAKRGDYAVLDLGDADGYVVTELKGTWAREA